VGALRARHEPTSAALVRREIAADLGRRAVDPAAIDDVVLVASELVSNAIRHAPATQTHDVCWDFDPTGVTVRVRDSSDRYPVQRAASSAEPGGRGLRIIAAMSDGWGVQPVPGGGKEVWAHIRLQQAVTAG
jgi:anti-sigma regulatory factor (Ser/Thr protein kinase)